jgi:hypothetical protein
MVLGDEPVTSWKVRNSSIGPIGEQSSSKTSQVGRPEPGFLAFCTSGLMNPRVAAPSQERSTPHFHRRHHAAPCLRRTETSVLQYVAYVLVATTEAGDNNWSSW